MTNHIKEIRRLPEEALTGQSWKSDNFKDKNYTGSKHTSMYQHINSLRYLNISLVIFIN